MKKNFLIALGAAGMLSGCATTAPSVPATLAYARTDCATVADTSAALSLVPERSRPISSFDHTMDAAAPCMARGGVSAPYMVFELPGDRYAKMIEIGGVMEYARVLSPKVVLLDADGAEVREFTRDQYMFRPGLLSVQFVPQENERYALVTVDPEAVGKSHDTIVAGTQSTVIYTGFGASNWRSGHEAMMSRGYSFEGPVRVLIYRPDMED